LQILYRIRDPLILENRNFQERMASDYSGQEVTLRSMGKTGSISTNVKVLDGGPVPEPLGR
ncbi:MAG: hypothetical protein RLZZ435_2816, partial [Cyanobacteriota bacterium]